MRKINWGIKNKKEKDEIVVSSNEENKFNEYKLVDIDSLFENKTPIKKLSIDNSSRKGSINPNSVDFLRRSRFNSRAEDLKRTLSFDEDLTNELKSNLGADIGFYKTLRLTDQECLKMSAFNNSLLTNNLCHDKAKSNFLLLIDMIPCEKFIAVGYIIEYMFLRNFEEFSIIKNFVLYLFESDVLDKNDIKHG